MLGHDVSPVLCTAGFNLLIFSSGFASIWVCGFLVNSLFGFRIRVIAGFTNEAEGVFLPLVFSERAYRMAVTFSLSVSENSPAKPAGPGILL